jgi:hypothetical protein
MRILSEYIDLEINILIIKILLMIYQEQPMSNLFLGISILLSLLSIHLVIKYIDNRVSESEKLVLRGNMIISFVTIVYNIINIYLNNPRQILIACSIFSFIYNYITSRGYKNYLSPFLKKKKNKYTYIKNTKGDLSCSICLDTDTDIKFVQTSCGHHYHKDCISKWVELKDNCPNCRMAI